MKDKEKCIVCSKDITNELPKIDINGNHYCSNCYLDKCKKELKEKQVFDKFGNYDFPTEITQDGLNTATSQIGEMEMAKECINCIHEDVCGLGIIYGNCRHYQPKLVVQPTVQSYSTDDNDLVVLSRKELEEKYEPSETFMAVARELEDLKQNLEDGVLLSSEDLQNLANLEIGDWASTASIRKIANAVEKQTRKEMAEKILIDGKQLVEKWLSKDDEKVGFMFDFEEFIKEQLSIEI